MAAAQHSGFEIVASKPQTACAGTLEEQIWEIIDLLENSAAAKTEEERAAGELLIQDRIIGSRQKIDAINGVLAELAARESACKAEAKRISARAKAAKNNIDRLRKYVCACATILQTKRMEGITSGFTIVPLPDQLDIFNAEELPAEYIEVQIEECFEPRKDAIEAALRAGTEVPGAKLITGRTTARRK